MPKPKMRADEAQLYVYWSKARPASDKRAYDKWSRDFGIIGPNRRLTLRKWEGLSLSSNEAWGTGSGRWIVERKNDPEDVRFIDLSQTGCPRHISK
jgi:hypothetical protein